VLSRRDEMTINPLWTAYNNLHNEGGEGYNPHEKHVSTAYAEPLWSKLENQAYRLQNRINGTSDIDPNMPNLLAELATVRAAAKIASDANI
jgi:hypothetical protein